MDNKERQFLKECCEEGLADRFERFFRSLGYGGVWFDESLTRNVLASVELKHRFAKWIVEQIRTDKTPWCYRPGCDVRLMALIHYQVWVHVLNSPDMSDNDVYRFLFNFVPVDADCHHPYFRGRNEIVMYTRGQYLEGWCLSSDYYSPVWMNVGGDFHPSYRNFFVNLLCFRERRFVLGCRCDSRPIIPDWMLYHKGCRPLGIKTDSFGREWTTFEVDSSLTDDNTAVFSNGLDGDGTVEVCDWVNERDVRVIFRANF